MENKKLLNFSILTASTIALVVSLSGSFSGSGDEISRDNKQKITELTQKVSELETKLQEQDEKTGEKISDIEGKISEYDNLLGTVIEGEDEKKVEEESENDSSVVADPIPSNVQVETNGSGLHLREEPTLSGTIVTILSDGEDLNVIVDAGRQYADNKTWLKVEDQEGNTGWVVQQFTK